MKHLPIATTALALGIARPAHAFDIEAHRTITARAVALEAAEHPDLTRHALDLAFANVAEDLNLVVKWAWFNHYFSPAGPVRTTWRVTSDVRVAGLEDELVDALLAGDEDATWSLAGHLLHHVQDMASPPHVVPVEHGLGDGFESYALTGLVWTSRGTPVAAMTGPRAHAELARRTWDAVEEGGYEACGERVAWSDWWRPEAGSFGAYGREGNRFGEPGPCPEEAEAMRSFATARVDDAVGYSRAVIRDVLNRVEGARIARR